MTAGTGEDSFLVETGWAPHTKARNTRVSDWSAPGPELRTDDVVASNFHQVPDLAAMPADSPTVSARERWWKRYRHRVLLSDGTAIATAVVCAHTAGLASIREQVAGAHGIPYIVASLLLGSAWFVALATMQTSDRRIVGSGNMEYQRVVTVSWRLFAVLAVASFLAQMQTGRLYLAIAFLSGTTLLVTGRVLLRKCLHARRRAGECMRSVLVVGTPAKAERLAREFARNVHDGYSIEGICTPSGIDDPTRVGGHPVIGNFSNIAEVARKRRVDLVAVSGADAITAEHVQSLGWDLEGFGIDLSVALSMADTAGPRLLLRPAGTLPIAFVDEPYFSGLKYALKSIVDRCAAASFIICLTPVLLAAFIAVRVTSSGPAIYRQARIGKDGEAFSVYKFRSMYKDAESRLEDVLHGAVPMFYKRPDDPRVTPVGRLLRRYSVDELPQLFNVLRGDMSLVGPRPQIAREVAQYDRKASRRLLVKPGLTGLWQVSGRSKLSVDDSIRLDVYYVENWTLFGDALILIKTLRAVIKGDGAF